MKNGSKVSAAQMRATAKYEKENYDKVLVRFPKGIKNLIKTIGNQSINSFIVEAVQEKLKNKTSLKCYRVLYKPDNTAFMVWADSKLGALLKIMPVNESELENEDEKENAYNEELYIIDEFTPDTNKIGRLTFYDCYEVYPRKDVEYKNRIQ